MLGRLLSYLMLPLLLLLSSSSGDAAPKASQGAPEGFNAGPDIITGDVGLFGGLEQYGSDGTQVGLGISTTSCNAGNVVVNFQALPATTHPVIMHNLYRMSSGAGNNERFEQIGQSWVKHAFGADQSDTCFTCQPGGNFSHLGVGCADTYANYQSAEQTDLGSRALINPFTGVFQSTANDHTGHTHTGTSHRLLVEGADLNTTLNGGATYYAEVQYLSSDEYAWCQTHAGQCNMYNNASYRQYSVSGTTSFIFSEVGSTTQMLGAVNAWTGATIHPIEPAPGVDGRAFIAYKVTNPSAGVYHYEYAIYNENLDRAIQSFSVPLGCAITLNNPGFHAPLNHPGFPNDGTVGGAGFSNAPWTPNQTASDVSWTTETFAQNPNANAIRWGTLYNFRFDSDKAPVATNATIGFFKTGTPITVAIQGPNACDGLPTPTATATATASPTPPATATPSPSATPTATASPSATPFSTSTPTATAIPVQAINLSTRMFVQAGDSVGIGGFIISGTAPKHVLLRAVGPSLAQFGVPNPLADPVLELHGPPGFVTIANDNCGDGFPISPPESEICPPGSLNSAIDVTLDPGAYTAIVKDKNNTAGLALIEVYDLNPAAASKLANISTRAFIGTGDNIVIAGFMLAGDSGFDKIIIRGIGPSLGGFGVPNALADPTLELRDNNGVLLLANDNWQDNATMPVLPPGLQPTNPLESVIMATLPPGVYTSLLTGRNNGTGIGLIEVYDLGPP
jgi:hypothetical protein